MTLFNFFLPFVVQIGRLSKKRPLFVDYEVI
jgi:hypothetical protein